MSHVPRIVSLDTETALFKGGCLVPQLVCISTAYRLPLDGQITTALLKHDFPGLAEELEMVISEPEVHLVGARIAYDMAVLCNAFPNLWPHVWRAYEQGRIHDVQIIEKLISLSTTGEIEFIYLPDGTKAKKHYNLVDLEKKYLGIDRTDEKKKKLRKDVDEEDIDDPWRERYAELIDVPIEEWPEEARKYPIDDAVNPLLIYEAQQKVVKDEGHGSANTASFQAGVDFALWLATAWGVETDPERVEALAVALERELNAERMAPLYKAGILRPAQPPRPYANNPDKTTKGKDESVNKKVLQDRVAGLAARFSVPLRFTNGGASGKPQIATNEEMLTDLAPFDPVIALYQHRQELIKLRTTYLPVMRHGLVHFPFNILVKTGRASSRGSKKFPSTNGQNPPRIGGEFSVRECYLPRPGHVLISCDYSMLELCCVAQVTYALFGDSEHRNKINAGYDLHAYLGAQIAAASDDKFHRLLAGEGLREDPDAIYKTFLGMKKNEETKPFFKHYRTFAKPTGLGYPGGLGPDKFVIFAKTQYGVEVDRDTAERLRQIWHNTYPEMRRYFNWVNTQIDPRNVGGYAYTSPMGMYRAGCLFTDCANGKAMQTPAAEGAKTAVFQVSRACHDPTLESPLYGCHMVNFLHDEILLEIPRDEYIHERAYECARIMVESMRYVLPDVTVKVEPCAMDRWYKEAETVFDDAGRLTLWHPKEERVS